VSILPKPGAKKQPYKTNQRSFWGDNGLLICIEVISVVPLFSLLNYFLPQLAF
jgi:hypothetical protein